MHRRLIAKKEFAEDKLTIKDDYCNSILKLKKNRINLDTKTKNILESFKTMTDQHRKTYSNFDLEDLIYLYFCGCCQHICPSIKEKIHLREGKRLAPLSIMVVLGSAHAIAEVLHVEEVKATSLMSTWLAPKWKYTSVLAFALEGESPEMGGPA